MTPDEIGKMNKAESCVPRKYNKVRGSEIKSPYTFVKLYVVTTNEIKKAKKSLLDPPIGTKIVKATIRTCIAFFRDNNFLVRIFDKNFNCCTFSAHIRYFQ